MKYYGPPKAKVDGLGPSASDLRDEGERVWPRGWHSRRLAELYEWDGAIYALKKDRVIGGPYDEHEAVRMHGDRVARAFLDGTVLFTHTEESGYGSSKKYVKELQGCFVVYDEVDESARGPFSSLDEAIANCNLLEIGQTSTEVTCDGITTSELIERLTLYEFREEDNGFVVVNGQSVDHATIYSRRPLDQPEKILAGILRELQRLAREGGSTAVAGTSPPARSYNEALARVYAGARRANDTSELRKVRRAILGKTPLEALQVLRASKYCARLDSVRDLAESMRRMAAPPIVG